MKIYQQELQIMEELEPANRTALSYFDGKVPLLYMSESFRHDLRSHLHGVKLNHARTVVTAMVNRLEIDAIIGSTDKSNKAIERVFKRNGKGQVFNDLFTKVSVFGQACLMAWPDKKGEWRLSVHDPRTTYVKYSDENPWEKEYVIRTWQTHDNDGKHVMRLDAFYADKIHKYSAYSEGLSSALNWSLIESVDNPFGEIPFFHFRNDSKYGRPEHFDAYNSQDAINKLVSEHMNTVEYQGAPQRYALANVEQTGEPSDFAEDDSARANIEGLKNGPGELWYLKGVNQVGSFPSADPIVFWNPIKDQIVTMASLTETPLHYFTGEVLSGPALRAAEAPLIKKVERRQEQYTLAIEEMFAFILGVDSYKAAITVNWNDGQALDELERWDVMAKKRNTGMPFKQVLRESGYSQPDIEKIMADKEEERQLGIDKEYDRALPAVRVQENNDETKISTGDME